MPKATAPVPGAVRTYKLVPITSEDAVAEARDKLVDKGWSVIERDWLMNPVSQTHLMVTLWAIPPGKAVPA